MHLPYGKLIIKRMIQSGIIFFLLPMTADIGSAKIEIFVLYLNLRLSYKIYLEKNM